MKVIFLFTLFVGLSLAHEYDGNKPKNLNCNCGWTNGYDAQTTHPWMVAIITVNYQEFLCAGSILTKRHVLTSADCLNNKLYHEILVCVGSKSGRNCAREGTKKEVAHISIRKGFDQKKSINNLALLRIDDAIVFSQFVGPACFPHRKISNHGGTDLTFLGWGGSKQLKKIEFQVRDKDTCKLKYPQIQQDIHICAVPKTEQNVYDDAGGIFVMTDRITHRYVVVGVLDNIPMTARPGNPLPPSLATNFAMFRGWVQRRVKWRLHAKLCHRK